jgi:hypothetical protein
VKFARFTFTPTGGTDILFNKNKLPDWKMLKEFLKYEGHITKEQCVTILKTV